MTRLLLRAANAPGLILLAAIGIAIQTSLFVSPPLSHLQPDAILCVVIWCALRRSFTEGGILTLLLGNLAEIHSAAPQGAFLVVYMLIFLGVRSSVKLVVVQNRSQLVILTLFASVAWRLLLLGLMHLLGAGANLWQHTLIALLPGALVEGLAGYWIYPVLSRFDWKTFKATRARQMLEDELQLEGEGL